MERIEEYTKPEARCLKEPIRLLTSDFRFLTYPISLIFAPSPDKNRDSSRFLTDPDDWNKKLYVQVLVEDSKYHPVALHFCWRIFTGCTPAPGSWRNNPESLFPCMYVVCNDDIVYGVFGKLYPLSANFQPEI
jgi:hypothetical protein